MKVPELKGGQMLTLAYFIGIAVILYIVYKFMGKIGLISSKESKKEDKAAAELRSFPYFDPLYLKDKMKSYTKLPGADLYVVELRQAIKGAGTDEEKVYAVFGKLRSKENISELALRYMDKYNSDLHADLLGELSDSEMLTLMNIINKLPNR